MAFYIEDLQGCMIDIQYVVKDHTAKQQLFSLSVKYTLKSLTRAEYANFSLLLSRDAGLHEPLGVNIMTSCLSHKSGNQIERPEYLNKYVAFKQQ